MSYFSNWNKVINFDSSLNNLFVKRGKDMSEIRTYPEMNEQIKEILKTSDEPHQLYASGRIEELENKLSLIQEIILENYPNGSLELSKFSFIKELFDIAQFN